MHPLSLQCHDTVFELFLRGVESEYWTPFAAFQFYVGSELQLETSRSLD